DDHPSPPEPGVRDSLVQRGQKVDLQKNRARYDLDYTGDAMPPPDAVKTGKAAPLSDEDRRTITRWIDLGCPIDLDYHAKQPDRRGYGWMLDDQRPTLTVTYPGPGANAELSHVLVGMHDFGSGLDPASFRVVADFAVDGTAVGENLAGRFKEKSQGVWELRLAKPIDQLTAGKLTVSVADRQGNVTKVERRFRVEQQRR